MEQNACPLDEELLRAEPISSSLLIPSISPELCTLGKLNKCGDMIISQEAFLNYPAPQITLAFRFDG